MMGSKTRVAFGLVLVVALLAAHTANAGRTIADGKQLRRQKSAAMSKCCWAQETCLVAGRICAMAQPDCCARSIWFSAVSRMLIR